MTENYSKRNDNHRIIKHFSSDKERHNFGLIDDEDLEIAYSDAEELPETLHINDLTDLFDWDDI